MVERVFRGVLAIVLAVATLPQSRAGAASLQRASDGNRDASNAAYDLLEDLTTEIGPRRGGTEAEASARTWAVARLKAVGFANVHIEPFTIPFWNRGAESAAIVAPFPRTLRVIGLGNSAATPPGGLTLPVVVFPTLDALRQAPIDRVRGRIVFVSHAMPVTQDGSGYAAVRSVRADGPAVAAEKEAAAFVMRSLGPNLSRAPHTGSTRFPAGVTPIPAAALSTIDADDLERVAARSGTVTMRLVLESRREAIRTSGNVVAEVPGTDPDAGIVLIGGHLDSWDMGTGALDDGAGLAITTTAARRLLASGPHRRTIRVVWFGNEELGADGAEAYRIAHGNERHALAAESDSGADRIWSLRTTLPDSAAALGRRVAEALAPLGVARRMLPAEAEADIAPMAAAGTPFISLDQSRTRYFDYHHTDEDTLDKIDPAQLAQNVAVWTAMLRLVVDAAEELGTPISVR